MGKRKSTSTYRAPTIPVLDALVGAADRVRSGPIAILSLIMVLSVWTVIGYINWMNDPDPDGVLSRRDAAAAADVAVSDIQPNRRPDRVVVLIIDGLRSDAAARMLSLNDVASAGFEATMDVGLPSMSRPVYGVLSSGTRQDRNGIRTNSFLGVATVDSFWERARNNGLVVRAVSNLDWWRALFPRGFDHYRLTTFSNFYSTARAALEADADVVLLHPTHVDFAGHQQGGRSEAYTDAVVQADRALLSLFEAGLIDLDRDALLILSDHGHRDKGGHGGDERHVGTVRCVAAGVGIAHSGQAVGDAIAASQIAPTLAVLMGVDFPRDTEDPPIVEMLDPATLGSDYLAERLRLLDLQRNAYLARLAEVGRASFDPADGFEGWREGMSNARLEGRNIRLGVAIAAVLVGFGLFTSLRRQDANRVILSGLSFVVFYVLAAALTQNIESLSVVEREQRYMLRLGSIGLIAFIGQHLVMRVLRVTDWDTVYLLGVWFAGSTVGLVIAHYGIPLTAPLPSPTLTFWPLFATIMTFSQALMGASSLVLLWIWERAEHRLRRRRLRALTQRHLSE